MSKIDLSIIIVNYKCWEVLTRCIESFNKYKPHTSYEIIVVDNNSYDDSTNIIARDLPEIKLIKNTINMGFSKGVNMGVKHCNASTDSILLLNPDTLVEYNSIQTLYNSLNDKVGIVGAKLSGEEPKYDILSKFPSSIAAIILYSEVASLAEVESDRVLTST